jgi:hypothetical protein
MAGKNTDINETVTALAASFDAFASEQRENYANLSALVKSEMANNKKKFRVIEARLNETRGLSIHDENEIQPLNIKEKVPPKINLSDLPKFKGDENPLVHIRTFKGYMGIQGIEKECWPTFFPYSLEAVPRTWFYSIDPKDIPTWEDIAIKFNAQYTDNVETQPSLRTLEVLAQKDNEGFTEYLTRWRRFSTQIPNHPSEQELISKFIDSLRPDYQTNMRYNNYPDFRSLIQVGIKIEDDLRSGNMPKHEGFGNQGNKTKNTNMFKALSLEPSKPTQE